MRKRILIPVVVAAALCISGCSTIASQTEDPAELGNAVETLRSFRDVSTGLITAPRESNAVQTSLVETWQLRRVASDVGISIPDIDIANLHMHAPREDPLGTVAYHILSGEPDNGHTLDQLLAEFSPEDRLGFAINILRTQKQHASLPAEYIQRADQQIKDAPRDVVCGSAYLRYEMSQLDPERTSSCITAGVSENSTTATSLDLAAIAIAGFRDLTVEEQQQLRDSVEVIRNMAPTQRQANDLLVASLVAEAYPELRSRVHDTIDETLSLRLDPTTGLAHLVADHNWGIEDTYQSALLLGEHTSRLDSEQLLSTLDERFHTYLGADDEVEALKAVFILRETGHDVNSMIEEYQRIREPVPEIVHEDEAARWATILDLNRKIGLDITEPHLELWDADTDTDKHNAIAAVVYSEVFSNQEEIVARYGTYVSEAMNNFDSFSGPTSTILTALKASYQLDTVNKGQQEHVVHTLRANPGCSWGAPFLSTYRHHGDPTGATCSIQDTASFRYAGGLPW